MDFHCDSLVIPQATFENDAQDQTHGVHTASDRERQMSIFRDPATRQEPGWEICRAKWLEAGRQPESEPEQKD